MPRRLHVKVKTADFDRYEDMRRYACYRDTPVTTEPIKQQWAGSKVTVHRFEEDGHTYLRQPSCLNRKWGYNVIDRYASFGVKAEAVFR